MWVPVIQDDDQLPCLESQLIVLRCLKVIEGSHLTGVLRGATVEGGVHGHRQRPGVCVMLLLLE